MDLAKQLVAQHFVLLFVTAAVFVVLAIGVAVFLFVQLQRNPEATWRTVMLELSIFRKTRRTFGKNPDAPDLSGTIAPGALNVADFKLPTPSDKPTVGQL